MRPTSSSLVLLLIAAPVFAQDPPPVETPAAPAPMVEVPPPSPPLPPAEPVASPAAPRPPEPGPAFTTGPVGWEALVEASYFYNFTASPNTEPAKLRAFDVLPNNFTLNYAKIAAYMTPDPVGFRIDLGYGHTGARINSTSLDASGQGMGDVLGGLFYGTAFIVQQAYASAKLGALTLDAGKFVTSVGDEQIETKENWNFSRSLLFYGQPFVHTGVRVGVEVAEQFMVQGSVVNGWNNDPDSSHHKTFGLKIGFEPTPEAGVSVASYIGKEAATLPMRMLFDLAAKITIAEIVGLSLNADIYKQGDAGWWGVGLKGRVLVADMFTVAARFEVVSSHTQGFVPGPPDMPDQAVMIYEGTLTAGVPITRNFEMRAEVRGDFSDNEMLFTDDRSMATQRSEQITALLGLLAWLP